MNYSAIKPYDIANGPGIRVSLFVSGCPHHCKGCFNQETWDYSSGKEFTIETMKYILNLLMDNSIKKNFSILGGEPLAPPNRKTVLEIIKTVKDVFPQITIYMWTGYLIEDLKKEKDKIIEEILDKIDVLIDGPFIQEKKDITLKLRGSSNQRIIKLKEGAGI